MPHGSEPRFHPPNMESCHNHHDGRTWGPAHGRGGRCGGRRSYRIQTDRVLTMILLQRDQVAIIDDGHPVGIDSNSLGNTKRLSARGGSSALNGFEGKGLWIMPHGSEPRFHPPNMESCHNHHEWCYYWMLSTLGWGKGRERKRVRSTFGGGHSNWRNVSLGEMSFLRKVKLAGLGNGSSSVTFTGKAYPLAGLPQRGKKM
jgi:hypothetical protein